MRRRRVYQTDAMPPATSSPPSERIAPIGAPVTGSSCPALTPPPVLMLGDGATLPCTLTLGPGVGTDAALLLGVGVG